jgi:hypothetical protein
MKTMNGVGRRAKMVNASGFIASAMMCDGHTWAPEKNLKGDPT